MNKIAISFAVGTSALFATAAIAAPLIANQSVAQDSNIQNVRMVCNENGRCWREHRDRRVIFATRMVTTLLASGTSNAVVMKNVAVSASALPA